MDTLKIAYKILYGLEHKKNADYMGQIIGPTAIGVDEAEWADTLQSLADEQYIAGVRIYTDIIGEKQIDIKNARITLKGAEYLHDNSAMRKIAKVATDVFSILK